PASISRGWLTSGSGSAACSSANMARRPAKRWPQSASVEITLHQGLPARSAQRPVRRLRAHARRDRTLGRDERRRARAGDGRTAAAVEFRTKYEISITYLVRNLRGLDIAEVAVPPFA